MLMVHLDSERKNTSAATSWATLSDWGEGGGGQGLNYFRAHIHQRFRHAHHETKDRQPGLESQGRVLSD